jgi:hypothetical protein
MDELLHDQAMHRFDEGLLLEVEARKKFAEAAVAEEQCFRCTGPDEPRTRGILLVSVASMWLKAGERARAEDFVDRHEHLVGKGFREEIARMLDCPAPDAVHY